MAWHATYNMEPSILDLQSCSVVFFKVLFQAGGGSRREDEDSGEAPLNMIDIERDEPAGLVRACPPQLISAYISAALSPLIFLSLHSPLSPRRTAVFLRRRHRHPPSGDRARGPPSCAKFRAEELSSLLRMEP